MASNTVDPATLAATAVQGKVIGFIRPPPDIRVIVDKTADFIGKMGDAYEGKIMASNAGNLKFGFLKEDDPYHAYYRHKVAEFRSGGAPKAAEPALAPATIAQADEPMSSDAGAAPTSSSSAGTGVQAASATGPAGPAPGQEAVSVQRAATIPNPIAKALKSFNPEMPAPKDEFTVVAPPYASSEDVDTIKLTAQFTATGGRRFLADLTRREATNPAFDFLRPTHALFGYYTALVDAYARVLNPQPATRERIERYAADPYAFLERSVHYLEWKRVDDVKRREAAAGAEAERAAAQIDWQDFVIVETIDFNDEEDAALPAAENFATTRAGAGAGASSSSAAGAAVQEVEMDLDMDTEEGYSANAAAIDEDDGEKLNIRSDYVPGSMAGAGGAGAGSSGAGGSGLPSHFIDPRTGASVPIDSAAEHLRIELLDPKWREQTARAAAKQQGTLFAGGDEVSENLRKFAARRSDIFREGEEEGSGGAGAGAVGPKRPRVGP